MARTRLVLTASVARQIVAFVRAGAFPHVAAQAAGIEPEVFRRWMQRGATSTAELYRSFRRDVLQAHAQARVRAEVAVLESKPFEWLRAGPGKEEVGAPGWTGPARPQPADVADRDLLADPQIQALLGHVMALLEPFPQARGHVGQELFRQG